MHKNIYINIISLFAVSIMLSSFTKPHAKHEHSPLKVIFIRHGEKPENGDNLSCRGLNRALQLPAVIESKFGTPDYVYVPSLRMEKKTKHARMFETITPIAVKYNLDINSEFDESDSTGIANNILKKEGTVLVVWEHKAISSILHAMGVKFSPKWKGEDYDTILILTWANGVPVLSDDKEGLNPSDDCP